MIRETAFATDLLLYRTLRCGTQETAVELQVGNHMSQLIYARRAAGGAIADADGAPLVPARISASNPDGRARALREMRDSVQNAKAAARCALKRPYRAEGLPGDALIVDVARTPADLEPRSTHAQDLLGEDFRRQGGCWVGKKGKVCALKS